MKSGIRSRLWDGLDVGSHSVKFLATQGGVNTSRYWIAETPLAVNGDGGASRAEAIAKTIAECISQAGLSSRALRGVTLGIAGPDVIVKQISLPLLDDSEV